MMKSLTCFLLVMLAGWSMGQECPPYYYLQAGQTLEMTLFDSQGKVKGRQVFQVLGVSQASGMTNAQFQLQTFTAYGVSSGKNPGIATCRDSLLQVDLRLNIPQDRLALDSDMEASYLPGYLAFPASLQIGDTLPPAGFEMDVTRRGQPLGIVYYDVTDRRVRASETVQTAAGTWDCLLIESSSRLQSLFAGLNLPVDRRVREWFAPGFGIVKSETYDRKGNLLESRILTGIRKG